MEMANLSITSACNRACSYCFTEGAFDGQAQAHPNMSRTTFQQALELLKRSGIDQVRLLGGEPTLHPKFVHLVDQVFEGGFGLLVFSNGLMPESAIDCLMNTPSEKTHILINISEPEKLHSREEQQLFSLFRRLGSRILLGMNIHGPGVRFEFMLDLIREFQLIPTIRLGLAHPCVTGVNQFLHPRYYSGMGERVLDFTEKAQIDDITIEFDCGFVPCMFPNGDIESLGKSASDIGRRCNPILDVLPDGSVASCYPLAGLLRIPLAHAEKTHGLKRRFEKKWLPYREMGIFKECSDCYMKKAKKCLGGCLALAMRRLRHTDSFFSVPENRTVSVKSPQSASSAESRNPEPIADKKNKSPLPPSTRWVIPYVDEPPEFWEQIAEGYADKIREVYFALPDKIIPTGRPLQPDRHIDAFLKKVPLPKAALVNPMVLPQPAEVIAPSIIEALKRLMDTCQLTGVTVSNLELAQHIREALPTLSLTASVLMDVACPNQALLLNSTFDTLVPASRIARDLVALRALKASFSGRIRLIVNEGCLPGCVFRAQHFYEMGGHSKSPRSLCTEILTNHPWMRLIGAWVLPQHLYLYEDVYDELKLAGRVTLSDPQKYLTVMNSYIRGFKLLPNEIGGGPASVLNSIDISERFFVHTLQCDRKCHQCRVCREYYQQVDNEV
jgi:Radical SAM superfamily/4Fe-4S single cluster domain